MKIFILLLSLMFIPLASSHDFDNLNEASREAEKWRKFTHNYLYHSGHSNNNMWRWVDQEGFLMEFFLH